MQGSGWKGSLLAACLTSAVNWNASTWPLPFDLNGGWLVSQCRQKSCFLLLKWNSCFWCSIYRGWLREGKGNGHSQPVIEGDWGQGVASVAPKLSSLAGCSKCGDEVIRAVFPLLHPTVPPGLDSFRPAAPFLLEKCFPALSKNENAGACQGALEDCLWWAAAVWSCSPWQTNNLQVNPQRHAVWSYKQEFVLMATAGAPKWAAGAREAIPPLRTA